MRRGAPLLQVVELVQESLELIGETQLLDGLLAADVLPHEPEESGRAVPDTLSRETVSAEKNCEVEVLVLPL